MGKEIEYPLRYATSGDTLFRVTGNPVEFDRCALCKQCRKFYSQVRQFSTSTIHRHNRLSAQLYFIIRLSYLRQVRRNCCSILVLCILGRFDCMTSPLLFAVVPFLSSFDSQLSSPNPTPSILDFLFFSFP